MKEQETFKVKFDDRAEDVGGFYKAFGIDVRPCPFPLPKNVLGFAVAIDQDGFADLKKAVIIKSE